MRKMPLTDAFFLITESRRTPMHVGGVNLFTLPDGVDDTSFLAELGEILSYDGELRVPFGEKLKMGPMGTLGSIRWQQDDDLDMDYHIRHSALPKPGRYRELFSLVSRLHSTLLDRSRPMWEMHLIEGLQNRQFATYMKAHHSAIDGIGAMHLTNSMMSPDPKARVEHSPFSMEAYNHYKQQLESRREKRVQPKEHEIFAVAELLREQLGGTVSIANALRKNAGVWMGRGGNLSVPWHDVPKTPYNTQITGARRFVAQSWSFERVRAVGKAFGGTLNDAVLAMCAGALRRHLLEQGELPSQSLKAMAPISLRDDDDVDSSTAVAFLTADLATQEADPATRIQIIQDSMAAAKNQFKGMSRREVDVYSIITQTPALIASLTGLASRFPAFSTVISNVPGPRQPMYWNGARLDGIYPVSIPFDGFAVNITLVSNNDKLDFGIVACRHSVPQVQRLIDYMEESLVELEQAVGLSGSTQAESGRTTVSLASAGSKPATKKAKGKVATKGRTKAKVAKKPKAKASAKTRTKAKIQSKAIAKTKNKNKAKDKAETKTKAEVAPKPG